MKHVSVFQDRENIDRISKEKRIILLNLFKGIPKSPKRSYLAYSLEREIVKECKFSSVLLASECGCACGRGVELAFDVEAP